MKKISLLILLMFSVGQLTFAVEKDDTFWNERSLTYKELYSQKNWPKFFSEALFFRLHLADSPDKPILLKLKDNYFALELMALSRHCQWDVISQFKKAYLQDKDISKVLPQSFKALDFIELKQKLPLPEFDQRNKSISILDSLKSRRDEWPVQLKSISDADSPMGFSVKIDSLCKSR